MLHMVDVSQVTLLNSGHVPFEVRSMQVKLVNRVCGTSTRFAVRCTGIPTFINDRPVHDPWRTPS